MSDPTTHGGKLAAGTATPRTNLLSSATAFVDRSGDRAAARQAFGDGGRLVTLVGPAGVGKTRLARELGLRWLADESFDEVWFCEIADATTASDLVLAVGATLRLPRVHHDPGEMLDRIERHLEERSNVLLILDNVEQLDATARAVIADGLARLPQMSCLATSREPLRLAGEVPIRIAPLDPERAIALFYLRAGAAGSHSSTSRLQDRAVAELVDRLDRLPLAIELAAARANILTPAQMVTRLEQRFQLLRDTNEDRPRRHQTLRSAVAWSWDLLEPWERAALEQCAVFEGGFSLGAAEALLDLERFSEAPWTVDVLSTLYDRSLLWTESPDGSVMRYHLFEAVREFVRLQHEPPARRDAERRHAEHFVSAAERRDEALDSPEGLTAMRWFREERRNLTAALDRAPGFAPALVARLALAVDRYLTGVASHETLLEVLDRAVLTPENPEDSALLARVLAARVYAYTRGDRAAEAKGDLERALDLAGAGSDALARFQVAISVGAYERAMGRWHKSRRALRQARALGLEMGRSNCEGAALLHLGLVESARAEADASSFHEAARSAAGYYQEALRVFRESGSRRMQIATLNNIGNLFARRGQRAEQRHYHEAALERSAGLEHRPLRAALLLNLGRLDLEEMRHRSAEERLFGALQIFRACGERRNAVDALLQLGLLAADRDDNRLALDRLLEACELCRALNDPGMASDIELRLGLVHLAEERFADARERSREAVRLAEEAADDRRLGFSAAVEAAISALLGDLEASAARWKQAEVAEAPLPPAGGPDTMRYLGAVVALLTQDQKGPRENARDFLSTHRARPERATPEVRLLARALDATRQSNDMRSRRSLLGGGGLVVGPDFSYIVTPGGSTVDLKRRRVLRPLLQMLVAQRLEKPGQCVSVQRIIERLWPDQRFVGGSGLNRVYTAIRGLRRLGFEGALLTRKGGYLLAPDVDIEHARTERPKSHIA